MGSKRLLFIIVAIVVAMICVGTIGVRSFVQSVYRERSCEWANIDNIEMHARIDIPSNTDCDCNFDTSANVKTAVFTLGEDVNFREYIASNKLKKVISAENLQYSDFVAFEDYKGKNITGLYYRSDNNYDSGYHLTLDTIEGKLWISIKYKR
ncbi:MAG TPA: hypothetical protein VGB50_02505 [Flavobacterium sp.]|jgi:hypothetical protein